MSRIAVAMAAVLFAGCAVHQFAQPSRAWTTRNGQLSYHGKTRALIGEVLVRYSNRGDFELTLTKGPGVNLLTVRTDATFARVRGPLAGLTWSGPLTQAPARARGWLALREEIMRNPRQQTFHVSEGGETFVLRF